MVNSSAVLAGASGDAAAARGKLGRGVEAFVVTRHVHQALDGASSHRVRAESDRTRLSMTLVASITGRLRGSAGCGRRLRVALEVAGVPVAALRALRRWAARRLGSRRNTALLSSVPVPAVGRARRARRGAGRVGLTAMGKAALLLTEAIRQLIISRS